MSHKDLVALICERVVEKLKEHETMMGLDHNDWWDDYQDHVVNGWSLVESMLMEYVENLIAIEIEKLPDTVQKALWWQTDKGEDAMFDAEWCYRHREPFNPHLGVPAEDDKRKPSPILFYKRFPPRQSGKPWEREALELAEADYEDDEEEDDSEETDK